MTEIITTELIWEALTALRTDLADMKRDIRDLRANTAMMPGMIGEIIQSSARHESNCLNLEARIERIEHRLDLQDHPPT